MLTAWEVIPTSNVVLILIEIFFSIVNRQSVDKSKAKAKLKKSCDRFNMLFFVIQEEQEKNFFNSLHESSSVSSSRTAFFKKIRVI